MAELLERDPLIEHQGARYKLVKSRFWGSFYVLDGKSEQNRPDLSFHLRPEFNRVPASLWFPIVRLFQHFAGKTNQCLEVGVYLLAKSDGSEWRAVVPRQEVSGASVRVSSFEDCVDLVTGKPIESFPPQGWVHAGDVHSHNSMSAFYSSIDDTSDVGQPGMHLVIGKVKDKSYEVCASVVQRQTRFHIDAQQLVELDKASEATFHENVLNYVTYIVYRAPATVKPLGKAPSAQSVTKPLGRSPLSRPNVDYYDYYYDPLEADFFAGREVSPTDSQFSDSMTLEEFLFEFQNNAKLSTLKAILAQDPELKDTVMDFIYTFSDLFEDENPYP